MTTKLGTRATCCVSYAPMSTVPLTDAGFAALIGRDRRGESGRCCPRRWPGCRGSRAIVWVGPPYLPSGASRGLSGWALVPVRSELTQPELPSVLPIRLWPWESKVPRTSGPLVVTAFAGHDGVAERDRARSTLYRPPPPSVAELPLTVQSVSVVVLPPLVQRPPPRCRRSCR